MKKTIKIFNPTLTLLEIQDVQSSCACTGVVRGKSRVPPLGWTELQVTLDTNRLAEKYEQELRVEVSPMKPHPLVIKLVGSVRQ